VAIGHGSPEELGAAIEGLVTSAEQAYMSRDGIQSLPKLVTGYEVVFRLKLGKDPPTNVQPLVI
jgi:hypothetical protein